MSNKNKSRILGIRSADFLSWCFEKNLVSFVRILVPGEVAYGNHGSHKGIVRVRGTLWISIRTILPDSSVHSIQAPQLRELFKSI